MRAAIANGAGDPRILGRHIFPNMLPTIIVQMTVTIPAAIIGEAVLSFLGLGVAVAADVVGRDALRREGLPQTAPRLVALPRPRDLLLLALVQPARRRPARRPRSADDAVSAWPLLEVDGLSVRFETDDGVVQAVDGLSFALDEREVLGIVGESGCGKSVSLMSLLRLLPPTREGRRHARASTASSCSPRRRGRSAGSAGGRSRSSSRSR